MRAGIRAGDGAVFLGAGADVRPFALAGFAFLVPVGKRGQVAHGFRFDGGALISRDAAEGRCQAALQQVHLGRHFVHQIGEFALMLGDERIFDAGGDVAPRLAHTVAHLVEEGAAVDIGPAREAEEFFLAAQDKALAGSLAEVPADIHLVEVDVVAAHAAEQRAAEHARAHGQDSLVGGPDDFLPQGAEEVVMVRARAEAGFLNDPVDIAELEVVLGGDVQLGGAALDELGGGALGRASGGLRWPQRLRGK